jgi:conjugal transfer/type IV secretion protein DotA/TraY
MAKKQHRIVERVIEEGKDILVNDLVGMEDLKKTPVQYLTGISAVKGAISSNINLAGDFFSLTFRMAKLTFSKEKVIPLPTDADDEAERFAVAKDFYGRSDKDIKGMIAATARQFSTYFICTVLLTCFSVIMFPHVRNTLPHPLDYIWPFASLLLMLPATMRMAFWNWQLRTRRLGSVKEWLSSGEWMPPGSSGAISSFSLLLFAVLTMVPSFAYAAGTSTSQASIDDYFIHMLSIIVGGIGPVPEGDGSPYVEPLRRASAAFTAALMSVGAGTVGWHMLAGTVSTAHEGKVLGQKFHQIWAPVRVTMGLSTLAPVSSGVCFAQLLVIQLIVWGGNLANTTWSAYLDAITATPTSSASQSGSSSNDVTSAATMMQMSPIFRGLARAEVCLATALDYAKKHPSLNVLQDTDGTPLVPSSGAQLNDNGFGKVVWDYGRLCGTITANFVSARLSDRGMVFNNSGSGSASDKTSPFALGTDVVSSAQLAKAELDAGKAAVQQIEQIRKSFGDMANEVVAKAAMPAGTEGGKVADVPNGMPDLSQAQQKMNDAKSQAANVVNTYVSSVLKNNSAVKDNSQSKFRDAAKKMGWATSGVFYLALAEMQENVFDASHVNFEVAMGIAGDLPDDPDGMKRVLVGADNNLPPFGTLKLFDRMWPETGVGAFQDGMAVAERGAVDAADSNQNMIMRMLTFATNWMYDGLIGLFSELNPNNPLQSMVDFGQKILNIASMLIITYIALAFGTSFFTGGATTLISKTGLGQKALGFFTKEFMKASGLDAILTKLAYIFYIMLIAIYVTGIVHAYVLPMIPYIMMTFFLLGMLVLTAEAFVAAPIWAFFHIRMDGQDFVDSVQRPGYMIAFNLWLRPTLATFGVVLSMAVFGAMAWFIGKTFATATNVAFGGHSVGPVGIMIMIGMVTYIHFHIAMRCFSLINQVPDRVTRWFGHGGEHLGEDQHAEKAGHAVIGVMSQRVDRMAGGAMARDKPGDDKTKPPGQPGGGGGGNTPPGEGNN